MADVARLCSKSNLLSIILTRPFRKHIDHRFTVVSWDHAVEAANVNEEHIWRTTKTAMINHDVEDDNDDDYGEEDDGDEDDVDDDYEDNGAVDDNVCGYGNALIFFNREFLYGSRFYNRY